MQVNIMKIVLPKKASFDILTCKTEDLQQV